MNIIYSVVFLSLVSSFGVNSQSINQINNTLLQQNQSIVPLPPNQYNFQESLSNYTTLAKELSLYNMTEDDVTTLYKIAKDILNSLKTEYISTQLKSKQFVFKELNGGNFPDMNKHNLSDESTSKFIRFVVGIYGVFTNLTDERIREIVVKSPLELVPMLKEIRALLQFVSAKPRDYGNAIFVETVNRESTVTISDETIIRIMRPIINKELINQSEEMTYKLSRITSAFCNEFNGANAKEIFEKTLVNLKRSTADNSRISFSKALAQSPKILDSVSSSAPEPDLQIDLDKIELIKAEYKREVEKYFKNKSTRKNFNRILFLAKELLGIRDNARIALSPYIGKINQQLQKTAGDLSRIKATSDYDKKKKKRDIKNCSEIAKFLTCSSVLFEKLYENKDLLPKIIQRDPLSILPASEEILTMLSIANMVMNETTLSTIVQKMRQFSRESEDGTHLLSPVLSGAMEKDNTVDFSNLVYKQNLGREYLKIR